MNRRRARTLSRSVSSPERRRGSAILLVLAGVAVIAFATTGALAAVVEMHRQEIVERAIVDAELAAEAAMARRHAAWEVREALGVVAGWREDSHAPPGSEAHSHIQRGAPGLWLLHGVGERQGVAGNPIARRSRTTLLRARPPSLSVTAPVTAAGTLAVGAGVTFGTEDTPPPGWGCHEAAMPAAATVALLPGAAATGAPVTTIDVSQEIAEHTAGILAIGAPTVGATPLTPTLSLPSLASPHVHHPSAVSCELGAPGTPLPELGWGDPARPSACERYHPFVHIGGDLTAPVGSGQGVLLIDGDLTVAGPFTWAGLLVVRGRLAASGPGFSVTGALVLLGDEPHQLGDGASIAWSSCSLRKAMEGSATVTPVTGTPWSSLR